MTASSFEKSKFFKIRKSFFAKKDSSTIVSMAAGNWDVELMDVRQNMSVSPLQIWD